MVFRVILLCNGVYKKTLYRCKKRETAFIKYHDIKSKNEVFYPKKFINTKKIIPVRFEICVVKPTDKDDVFRTLRDDYGRVYTEKQLGDWTILDSDDYLLEETFWLYGEDNKINRPNIAVIIKKLLKGAHARNMVKQIIVVHNKLIIYNENQFDMVLCKNLEDAQRLHHTLAKIAKKQKIKSLIFMGTASKVMISNLYELIVEKTGWKIEKIRRTSTRP